MPRLPQARTGQPLLVKGRPLTFSYFPVKRDTRRYGLQDVVFAVDPWAVAEGAVNDEVPVAHRHEAVAFVEQARAFYEAGAARTPASPLLTYYAFLNLGKALIRCRGFTGSLDLARHGLSEAHTGSGLSASSVNVHDGGPLVNVFPELIQRLGFSRPAPGPIPVLDLAPQIVVGHRLWREASIRTERFVVLEDIEFIYDRAAKALWLRLWLRRSDLSRYEITRKRLLDESRTIGLFREVDAQPLTKDPDLVCLEQQTDEPYTGRPTDVVRKVVDSCRPWLWRIITAGPGNGYRRYYLHLTPPTTGNRVSQIASIWMLMFFFGSVVRYRPQEYAAITNGRYGAWAMDFAAAQPEQLLFMLTSEMRQREVARPAIV
jgi:hypothetical protein